MVGIVQSEKYGIIKYEESFWTGSRKIYVGNSLAKRITTKNYVVNFDDKEIDISLVGNFMTGVTLLIDGEEYAVIDKTKWYEYILAVFPFAFVLVWGNIPASVDIFPVVGGAIGGLISGAMAVVSLASMKKTNKVTMKIVIGLVFVVITLLITHIVAKFILSL